MIDIQTFSQRVDGLDYACLMAGEGPLALLLHGTLGGKELLIPQIRAVAATHRCVGFDWRGHGGSGFDPRGWGWRDLMDDLSAMIASLGNEPAVLIGVSQGAAIAMRLALHRPNQVAALVNMCGGPGPAPSAALEPMRELTRTLRFEANEASRRLAAEIFAARFFHAADFPEKYPDRFKSEIDVILSHPKDAVQLLPDVPAGYDDISDAVHRISCPTHIIWGECDGRPGMGRIMADAIGGATLSMMPNAGHHANVDAPDLCNAAITRFLGAIRA